MRHVKGTAPNGFTLIEVLVALAILVGSLGLIFEILVQSRQRVEAIAKANKGLIIAQSKLAEYAESQVQSQGEQGIYQWRATNAKHEPDRSGLAQETTDHHVLTLEKINISVDWPSGSSRKKIELTTLRPTKGSTK
ncbi:type II secretion system GspH family protein [Porticoccaceae bacterium]|nr:type II secretion system GspH family protein [Porticoccaceae bacterium]